MKPFNGMNSPAAIHDAAFWPSDLARKTAPIPTVIKVKTTYRSNDLGVMLLLGNKQYRRFGG